MYRARTKDGQTFSGKSPAGVVRSMKRRNWQGDQRKGLYMTHVIQRVEQMTGIMYRGPISAQDFLNYLVARDLLTITEDSVA